MRSADLVNSKSAALDVNIIAKICGNSMIHSQRVHEYSRLHRSSSRNACRMRAALRAP